MSLYSLLKQNIKSCIAKRRGNENSQKNQLVSNKEKNNFTSAAHFVVHNSLPLFCTTTSRNF